jgi:hypothetical protein
LWQSQTELTFSTRQAVRPLISLFFKDVYKLIDLPQLRETLPSSMHPTGIAKQAFELPHPVKISWLFGIIVIFFSGVVVLNVVVVDVEVAADWLLDLKFDILTSAVFREMAVFETVKTKFFCESTRDSDSLPFVHLVTQRKSGYWSRHGRQFYEPCHIKLQQCNYYNLSVKTFGIQFLTW